MSSKEFVAMILAGGRGERLGALTRYYSKPVVHFGGSRRLIDFTLQNCIGSNLSAIGILSQHFCIDLQSYIETTYDCEPGQHRIYMLPPKKGDYYSGTADAVLSNIDFVDKYNPEHVLILAGDHIYDMDYDDIIAFHREHRADVTIASTDVPLEDANRFGILGVDKSGQITRFDEKPNKPKGRLASMGVYVFKWGLLKRYLRSGNNTAADFGKNIIPEMLRNGELMYAYRYDGYWQDVGTVESLLESSMDQINYPEMFRSGRYKYLRDAPEFSDKSYRSVDSSVRRSLIFEGCSIFGSVDHSVISDRVTVCEGAEITDSYIMPGAYIGAGAKIHRAIVGTGAMIIDGVSIGKTGIDYCLDRKICTRGVSLVSPWLCINQPLSFQAGSHITEEMYKKITQPNKVVLEPYYGLAGGFSEPSATLWHDTRPFAANAPTL